VQELFADWLTEAESSKVIKLSKPPKSYSSFLYNTLCGLKVLSQSGSNKAELNNVIKVTLAALN
jgi:hypothetical protein